MKFLIVGASRGYGAEIANVARSKGIFVLEAQRHPRAGLLQEGLYDSYEKLDLHNPEECVDLVNLMCERKLVFDAVLFAASINEEKNPSLITSFDLLEHMHVNVAGPAMLATYLQQWDRLNKEHGIVGFLCDRTQHDKTHVPYAASKGCLIPFIENCMTLWEPAKTMYFTMPQKTSQEQSHDMACERVVKILSRKEKVENRIVNLMRG